MLDDETATTGELVQSMLPGARVGRAFSNILAHHIPQLARPEGADDRTVLPVAGDDEEVRAEVSRLVSQLGFDTLDAGPMAEAWRFEPEADAYTRLYLADPATPDAEIMTAPAAPVGREELEAALRSGPRVKVADRQF